MTWPAYPPPTRNTDDVPSKPSRGPVYVVTCRSSTVAPVVG
ncbi:Uncharacterised protein [Mycobacteroides abscessus]|nr:Uncharacterised protein [Mycobacteroides abscessus]